MQSPGLDEASKCKTFNINLTDKTELSSKLSLNHLKFFQPKEIIIIFVCVLFDGWSSEKTFEELICKKQITQFL